jgi:hypothetical protein
VRKIRLITGLIMVVFTVSQDVCAADNWQKSTKEELMSAYNNAIAWFSKTVNYQVDIQYASYSNYFSAVPYDRSDGVYKKSNTNFYSAVLGVNITQNEKMRIVVDTAEKMIILNNKTQIDQPVDSKAFSGLLDNAGTIKKQTLASGEKAYRIEFKNGTFSAYEFRVDAAGLIAEVKYFYAAEMEDGDDNKKVKGKPRIEIRFSNYRTDQKFIYEKEFSEKKYFKTEGAKMVLADNYKNFELKDYRFSEKK